MEGVAKKNGLNEKELPDNISLAPFGISATAPKILVARESTTDQIFRKVPT
jgi:hypothetical protein